MLTIREIKARTEAYFLEKAVPNPKLDTDILIAHSLGIKRLELYLDMDRPLVEAQLSKLRPLVKRRAAREPLQHIVGCTDFYGLKLKVDRRALIPRHETEELIERIVERLTSPPHRILDLGTGSGALALALASQYSEAEVTAVEQSTEALALARENADALKFTPRIRFLQGSWWAPIPTGETFDLIVSNPPYLTEAEMQTAAPEVIHHEPHRALVAGTDGLDDLQVLLTGASRFLTAHGLFAMETGIAQSETLTQMATQASLTSESIKDLSGRPRFFFVRLQ